MILLSRYFRLSPECAFYFLGNTYLGSRRLLGSIEKANAGFVMRGQMWDTLTQMQVN